MTRTSGTRSVGRGLAKVEPTTSDTLIAFAARAGSTAADGNGENSPFTTALIKNIAVPGLDLRIAFGRVRDDVLKSNGNRQEPFMYGSLGGSTVALVPTPASLPDVAAPPLPGPSTNPTADIRRDYELAAQVGTKEAWEAFLSIHKIGFHADLARQQLAKLNAEEAKKAADDAKKAAEEAKKAKPATKPEPSQAAAPPTSRSANAPKANTPQIVCNRNGCQEVKPGTCVQTNVQGAGVNMQCY
jgi:uncharacterized caspase-like protein